MKDDAQEATKLYNLGILLANQNKYSEAEEAFRAVLKYDPKNAAPVWYNLGFVLDKQNKYAEAEEAYRTVLKHDPQFGDAWYNLGILLANQNKYAEAEEAYRTVLKHDPQHSNAWAGLGVCLSYQDKDIEAEEAFRTALKYDSKNAEFWIKLGILLGDQEKYTEAEKALRTSLKHDPTNLVAQKILEDILERKKRKKKKKKKKISPNEFDSYTKELRDYLYKQMEVVDVCGMKYPMPSWEAVRAIERGFDSFPLIILTDIEQLQIKEDLLSDIKDLESQMSSFKKSPDGPSFQQLLLLMLKLDKLMDDLGKKYKTNYTSPGYSLDSADY